MNSTRDASELFAAGLASLAPRHQEFPVPVELDHPRIDVAVGDEERPVA